MIGAVIITYNPNIERLSENLTHICCQVDKLLIVDNNSKNVSEIEKLQQNYNFELKQNEQNEGISINLNLAIRYYSNLGFEWLLTLDQDSICDFNLIKEYKDVLRNCNKNLVSLCPQIIDMNLNDIFIKKDNEEVTQCITSGNLINISFIKKLGGFDEFYFIDSVDFDLCAQIKNNGGIIVRVNSTYIKHEVGNAKKHKLFNKIIFSYNHTPLRSYYIVRNECYFKNKYKKFKIINYNRHPLIKHLIIVCLYEKKKYQKFKYSIKGYSDFKSYKGGRLS